MGNFYSRLSYSFGNEDWRTEQKALKIQPDSRVLSITASGDRPLNLLTTELAELVTIDANPMQNALFDLKKTAIKQLDYHDYLAFLGVESHPHRFKTYISFEKELHSTSIALWNRHPGKISRGVLYEGAVEKWLKRISTLMRPLRGQKIDQLFAFDDLELQRIYLKETWQTYLWKKTFQVALHPWLSHLFINDPGLYAYIAPDIHVGTHLYDKLHSSLDRFLAKESVLLSLLFKGMVEKEQFPPYLAKEGFEQIKKRLDRVMFETIDIASYLEKTPENSFDRFSCSDIASYIDKETFDRVCAGIVRTAKPGARFCIRQFLSNHQIPSSLSPYFERDSELEEELEREDRCFVYRFTCGAIKK